jgi:hypothetical protein
MLNESDSFLAQLKAEVAEVVKLKRAGMGQVFEHPNGVIVMC